MTQATQARITEQDPSLKRLRLPKAVQPRPIPPDATLDNPALYFNQELGWVDFNWRVLHLALDERTPLLERVRFVAITASNLDEFTQKRIGGLKRQEAAGVTELSMDGRTPREQLAALRKVLLLMHQVMTASWERLLKPVLEKEAGIVICNFSELSDAQRIALQTYFQNDVYPVLTPLTVDPGHPFPFISNLSLSLAVILRHPKLQTVHFARLKVPPNRWVPVPDFTRRGVSNGRVPRRFIPVEQLIAHHAAELFPGMEVVSVHPFRITRNADVERDEEVAEDLLALISDELRERRFAPVVRLETDRAMPEDELDLLKRELGLTDEDIYMVDGLMDLTACFQLADLDYPQFKYDPWEPLVPARLVHEGETKDTRDLFAIIRNGDLLVHHPYESFAFSVQRFIEEAAADPDVVAIKQTLYRTSSGSPIIEALMRAGESGKSVAVMVEVKARFDEANNIEWGRMLGNAGVHVAYGLVGLKTHSKATLVVRRERDGLRTYCHIGTGNYNSKTARLYTDLGLFTADPDIGLDLINLFHYLTGYAPGQEYEKVMVAPRTMRSTFHALIDKEIANHQAYGNGHIIAKMNALDDKDIMKRLHKASQAGVRIDLIIRGHTLLRPGLPGFSENIHIISILGRFLEHDRTYYFHNNGDPQIYIGSADWRTRNLKSRVELIAPVEDPTHKKRLIKMLNVALNDNRSAWDLDADGQYTLRYPAEGEKELEFQRWLMKRAQKTAKKVRKLRR